MSLLRLETAVLFTVGQYTSVDAFLELRPDFIECGKAAMAAALIPCEDPTKVINRGADQRWYEYLFAKVLATHKGKFDLNHLAVVTFNYDRSLEFFLLEALMHSFGLPPQSASSLLLDAIPIFHVYGQLGPLKVSDGPGRAYSAELTSDTIRLAAKGIRIIHEGDDGTEGSALANAHRCISEAEVVAFLGFGFHSVNVSRLRVDELMPQRSSLLASGFGLKRAERREVQSLFKRPITIGAEEQDVLWFLRDYPVLVDA